MYIIYIYNHQKNLFEEYVELYIACPVLPYLDNYRFSLTSPENEASVSSILGSKF